MEEPGAASPTPLRHPVARLSALSLGALIADRALGLGLLALVAALFGASAESDTFLLAFIVPATIGVALSEALYTALLPPFQAGGRAALASAMRATALATGFLGIVYAGTVIALPLDERAAWIALAPLSVAMPVAGALAALLVAERRYALATMRVPLASALALAGALLVAVFESVAALALAVGLGHLAAATIVAGAVLRGGGQRVRPTPLALRTLLGPAASVFSAALVGGQLIVLLERALAAGLASGSVALLSYARGFALLPVLLPQALAAGVFPAAAERRLALEQESVRRLAILSLRIGLVSALTAGIFVVITRRELVRLLLERGELDAADAAKTARLVAVLSVALMGTAAATVAGRILFALDRGRVVAGLTSAGLALYAVMALVLRELEGVGGLAAAFSAASIVTGTALTAVLARELEVGPATVLRQWVAMPILLAAVFGGGAVLGAAAAPDRETALDAALVLLFAGVGGSVTLGLAALLARGTELEVLRSRFGR